MTTTRYYATSRDPANPQGWTNPDNILNAEDDVCTEKIVLLGSGYKRLQVYFTIILPITAIISAERINAKGTWTADILSEAGFELNYTSSGGVHVDKYVPVGRGTTVCLNSQWNSGAALNLAPYLISLSDLNSGNFLAYGYLQTTGMAPNAHAYIDAVYIEVDYTIPSAAVTRGDGLTWITALKKWNTYKSRFQPLKVRRL